MKMLQLIPGNKACLIFVFILQIWIYEITCLYFMPWVPLLNSSFSHRKDYISFLLIKCTPVNKACTNNPSPAAT